MSWLRLTDGEDLDVGDPTAEEIVRAVGSLDNDRGNFAILERGGQVYMQVTGGPERFMLEYRDGSKHRHFQCEAGRELAVEVLLSYATRGDERWLTLCDWSRLDFD